MNYPKLTAAFFGEFWAMEESKLALLTSILQARVSGVKAMEDGIHAKAPTDERRGKIAVINLFGTITQRGGMMGVFSENSGGMSTENFGQRFDAAVADRSVESIVINTDSPGGSVSGVQTLANKVFAARASKRIVAISNSQMASAAYWIASAADQVFVEPGSLTGSIGVIAQHLDTSGADEKAGNKVTTISAGKYKAEGAHGPLNDEALQAIQATCDAFYSKFVAAVAEHRRTTPSAVKAGYGQGRQLTAEDAVAAGLADKVASLEKVIKDLSGPTAMRRRLDLLKNG